MNRASYFASVNEFGNADPSSILGELAHHHQFHLEYSQKNAWEEQIVILKMH